MAEVKRGIKSFEVKYKCDKCGVGFMEATGTILTSDPPQRPHKCNACEYQETFYCKYPQIGYEYTDIPTMD